MRRIGNSQGFVIRESVVAGLLQALTAAALILSPGRSPGAANVELAVASRSIGELKRTATIHLGKTADWVAITADAVWVGSTGPFAVHRIDPTTNKRVATVKLQGEPCSGLATGFGSLWVPLCGKPATLARVDHTTALGIAGKGGDIGFGGGMIWTTVSKVPLSMIDGATAALLCQWVGPGGDSLGIGHGAIWLTDYHAGTISRIELDDAIGHCKGAAA